MRLDLFLKKTMIIKRRVIAKEIVEKGHAFVNDKVAKPSTEIKDGDIIQMNLGPSSIVVKAEVTLKNNKEVVSYELISKTKRN